MNYPIVKIKTKDDVTLHGVLFEPDVSTNTIIIHIHGTAGSFFWNDFLENLVTSALNLNIAQLNTNNRGAGVYELEVDSNSYGASLELFEDCTLDIDAWIEFALSKGYTKIILEGHSFGTEKIVYYMNKGKHASEVIAVILLGFSDTIGTEKRYEKKTGKNYFEESNKLVQEDKGNNLISDLYGHSGELPISANTYLNFFSENSGNSQALPLRQGKDLVFFQNINVPILGVIGDNDQGEYTIIPLSEAINLLKSENKLAEIYQIKDCDHGFNGKEKELASIISKFLKDKIII